MIEAAGLHAGRNGVESAVVGALRPGPPGTLHGAPLVASSTLHGAPFVASSKRPASAGRTASAVSYPVVYSAG
ncbi:MAG: hypothetical protein PVG07_05840 [Acidobacteriota bacterium]|jgi:hypothetical protein